MKISIIATMDHCNGIGYQGKIPWRLSKDMVHFKETTMGHYLLMGDVTWEGMARNLPGRQVIVLTQNLGTYVPKFAPTFLTNDLNKAIQFARESGEQELIVAGGAAVYRETIAIASTMYLTIVEKTFLCDRFFPSYNPQAWTVEANDKYLEGDLNFTIMKLVRNNPRAI